MLTTSPHPVKNYKLYECGLCGNPYPYQCKECTMEVTQAIIETTARDMGITLPPKVGEKVYQQLPPEENSMRRIYIGSGEDFDASHYQDCSC